jgi:hypothetical protein
MLTVAHDSINPVVRSAVSADFQFCAAADHQAQKRRMWQNILTPKSPLRSNFV